MSREIKNFSVAFLAGLFGLLFSLPTWAEEPETRLQISIQDYNSLPKEGRVLLDTRSKWQYLWGHIPGALPSGKWQDFVVEQEGIPGQLNRDKSFLARRLSELGIDHSKSIVLYGDPTDKWRQDGRFFWMLEYLGFQKVYLLEGGFDSWENANLPLERGSFDDVTPSKLSVRDIKFNSEALADQDWIRKRLGNPKVAIIDNRERHEYEGSTPYGSDRGGHIPGAIHIDWRDFFNSEGNLKPQPELTQLLQSYRVKPGMEIIVYCTGGVRSAMAYFVFRLLGYPVRNYDGSWWDWSHNPALPVETT